MQGKRITRVCEFCGASFLRFPSETLRGRSRYCSRICGYQAARGHRRRAYPARVLIHCAWCGREFSVTRSRAQSGARFCAKGCAAASMRSLPTAPTLIAQRFWAKVNKHGPVPAHCPELGPCWLWTGSTDGHGYGHLTINYQPWKAHRFSWQWTHGSIPAGQWIMHRCDTPRCVNPAHLHPGTHAENMADMWRKGRQKPHALDSQAIRSVRARYQPGAVTLKALATEYGVTVAAISAVVRGKLGKHVD